MLCSNTELSSCQQAVASVASTPSPKCPFAHTKLIGAVSRPTSCPTCHQEHAQGSDISRLSPAWWLEELMPILHKDWGDFADNYHSCLFGSVFEADGSVGDVAECTGMQQSCSYKSALLWSSTNTALCVHKALNNQCNFQGGRRKFEKWDKNCRKTKSFLPLMAWEVWLLQVRHSKFTISPATSQRRSPQRVSHLLQLSDVASWEHHMEQQDEQYLQHGPLSACFQREMWAVFCFVLFLCIYLYWTPTR